MEEKRGWKEKEMTKESVEGGRKWAGTDS